MLEILESLDLPPETLANILAPFPVAGEARYSEDWGAPRYYPFLHSHEGVDIFAGRGTPVIASTSGVVSRTTEQAELGGISLRLTAPDGTYYYYAHLDGLALLMFDGVSVPKGAVLGYVGTSGNAEGGPPHLHFEIHPKGGPAVPPVPYLDRWLEEALRTAEALRASAPRAGSALSAFRSRLIDRFSPVAASLVESRVDGVQADATEPVLASTGVLCLALWLLSRRRRSRVGQGDPLAQLLGITG